MEILNAIIKHIPVVLYSRILNIYLLNHELNVKAVLNQNTNLFRRFRSKTKESTLVFLNQTLEWKYNVEK